MKKDVIKKLVLLIFLTFSISLVSYAHATSISLSLPTVGGGSNPCADPMAQGCNPGNYVSSFYQFALAIGGLLAFGAVVFGGVKYITAAGNPSSQSEGKAWIESALLGLLLLLGAYLILYTVNPNLTHLDLPRLPSASNPFGQGGTGGRVLGGGAGGS